LQLVVPLGQPIAQLPAEHTGKAGSMAQETLQFPQCVGSVWTSTHAPTADPPHDMSPGRQAHCESVHTWVASQAVVPVHLFPQTCGSPGPLLSVQWSRHATVPAQVHAPATQVSPGVQSFPHSPQFEGSVFRSQMPPAHALSGQVQTEATHLPVAPHVWAQVPQFVSLVLVSTHVPEQTISPGPVQEGPEDVDVTLPPAGETPELVVDVLDVVDEVPCVAVLTDVEVELGEVDPPPLPPFAVNAWPQPTASPIAATAPKQSRAGVIA
jgi:hypothetical protein